MMMVVVTRCPLKGKVAMLTAARLPFGLQLQCGVAYAVFFQLTANQLFDLVGVAVGHKVHGGIVSAAIHTPDVDVVNTQHTIDLQNLFFDLPHRNAVGHFFQKQINRFFQVANGCNKDKHSHANRQNGVDQHKARKAHYYGSHQHHNPAKHRS